MGNLEPEAPGRELEDTLSKQISHIHNSLCYVPSHLWSACHSENDQSRNECRREVLAALLAAARTDWLKIVDEAISLMDKAAGDAAAP